LRRRASGALFKHDNEASDSMTGKDFFDKLGNYQIPKKDSIVLIGCRKV
jgi:hypothetical protein